LFNYKNVLTQKLKGNQNPAHSNPSRAVHDVIRFPGTDCAIRAGRRNRPTMLLAAHESRREILGPNLISAADGGTRPKLRECSVSPALSCISFRKPLFDQLQSRQQLSWQGERQRRNVSARKNFRNLARLPYSTSPETHFSTALPKVPHNSADLTAHSKLGWTRGT